MLSNRSILVADFVADPLEIDDEGVHGDTDGDDEPGHARQGEPVAHRMQSREQGKNLNSCVNIFSSKIKCGDCGGWYGSKFSILMTSTKLIKKLQI